MKFWDLILDLFSDPHLPNILPMSMMGDVWVPR